MYDRTTAIYRDRYDSIIYSRVPTIPRRQRDETGLGSGQRIILLLGAGRAMFGARHCVSET